MAAKSTQCAIILIGICVTTVVAGCGKSAPKVEFAKVQGAVRVNGRPQPNVQVQFSPDREKGNNLPAFAGTVSDDKGNYTLKYSYMNKTGEGAPAGWNRVTLLDMSAGNPPKTSAIPPKYASPTTTPLLLEVKAGEENVLDLEVKK